MQLALSQQYQQILDQFGDIFGSLVLRNLPWAFLYGALGLLLALIIIGLMIKKNIMVRRTRQWNLLAKLAYIALLIVLPLASAAAGTLFHVQQAIHLSLNQKLLPELTRQLPAFNQYLASKTQAFENGKVFTVKDLIDPLIQDLYYVPKSDSTFERIKAKLLNRLILQSAAQSLTDGLQTSLTSYIEMLGHGLAAHGINENAQDEMVKMGVSVVKKFTTDAAREIDFTQVNASLPQVIVDAILGAIDSYFKSLYYSILLVLLLLIALIALEIYYYRRHLRITNNDAI